MVKMLLLWICVVTSVLSWAETYSDSEIVGKRVELSQGLRLYSEPKRGAQTFRLQSSARVRVLEKVRSGNSTYFKVEISDVEYFISDDDLTEAGILDCQDCSSGNRSSNTSDLRTVTAKSNSRKGRNGGAAPLQTLSSLQSPNPGGWDARCAGFIQSNGSVGAWGREFLSEASKVQVGKHKAIDYIKSTHLWKNMCPKFKDFSDAQKEHYIATFIAAKAMDEANCNPNAYSSSPKMPNPPGVGFFMLEGQSRLRRGRHSEYCGGGYKGTQQSLPRDLQFRCAAYQIVATQYQSAGPFCGGGSGYWQEANRRNGEICNSMKGYKACFE